MPGVFFCGQSAGGDDVVDMGMVLQLTAPGVQYAEETWKIAADEFFIGGQFFERIGEEALNSGRIAAAAGCCG